MGWPSHRLAEPWAGRTMCWPNRGLAEPGVTGRITVRRRPLSSPFPGIPRESRDSSYLVIAVTYRISDKS